LPASGHRALLLFRAAAKIALVGAIACAAGRSVSAGNLLKLIPSLCTNLNVLRMCCVQLKFSGYSTSLHSPHLSLTVTGGECCDCVSSVGHHILSEAIQAVTDACQDVTCPVIKQRCDWMLAHPGEMKGYLAVRLRPFSYASVCLATALAAEAPIQIR
jgi:hypothetical protein